MTTTLQGILDSMSSEERDIQAIVVAAAVGGIELDDQEITDKYNALPEINKHLIDFIVGHATAEDSPVEHADIYHSELAHYGVKGMRWGFRKDQSSSSTAKKSSAPAPIDQKAARDRARAKVKAGTGTLGDAHTAALKSTGHRITNGVLGDKTFWKRQLKIVGGVGAGVVASVAGPLALPADILQDIGAGMLGGYGTPSQNEAMGWAVLAGIGLEVTKGVGTIATVGNYANNAVRAVRGNARVRKSAENLGRLLKDRQNEGSNRVQKVLVRNGSIKKRRVKAPKVQHMDSYSLEGTLAHYGVKGMRWGVVKKKVQSNRDIKTAQKIVAGKRSSEGLSNRELQVVKLRARRRTVGQTIKRRTKQSALLAFGALVVKEYLEINGDTSSADISSPNNQTYEDIVKDVRKENPTLPRERNGPMFNPDATLDPSQVRVE